MTPEEFAAAGEAQAFDHAVAGARPRPRSAAWLAFGFLALGLSACTSLGFEGQVRAAVRIEVPGHPAGGIGIADVRLHRPISFGSITVCLSGPGKVRIVRAEPVDGHGVAITGVGVRPNPFTHPHVSDGMLGPTRRGLESLGFGSRTLTRPCSAGRGSYMEIAIQMERTDPGNGAFRGYRVLYRTAAGEKSVIVPIRFTLCPPKPKGADSRGCGP